MGGVSTQTANFTLNCPLASAQVAQPVQGRLSLTGSNSVQLALAALALVTAGSIAVLLTRRRRNVA